MLFNYTDRELDLLARIMRAEALGEGNLGMLMVGNVVANRVLADCLTFKNIDSIYDAIYQPNQFTGVNSSLFNASATTLEKQLAQRIVRGEYYHPATNALWFYSPTVVLLALAILYKLSPFLTLYVFPVILSSPGILSI